MACVSPFILQCRNLFGSKPLEMETSALYNDANDDDWTALCKVESHQDRPAVKCLRFMREMYRRHVCNVVVCNVENPHT